MQAISPTLEATQTAKAEPQTLIFDLTAAKVKQIALAVFAALAFGVAATLLVMAAVSSAIVPTFLALPLLTAAGLAVWKILILKDYDDPEQLATFKKEAETAPILETFEEHGAYNMVRYQLPATIDFTPLSLMEALALHEELHAAYVELGDKAHRLYLGIDAEQATHLGTMWMTLRDSETNICNLFADDSSFDIERVNAHGLFTEKEYPALLAAKQKYDAARVELKRGHPTAEKAHATFLATLQSIHSEYQRAING
jgi:hypothetical protein